MSVSHYLTLAFLFVCVTLCACQAPTVSVANGTYSGICSTAYNQEIFLGIPFAQPPTANSRFKKPLSLNTTWTGTRPAIQFGFDCPQYATGPGGFGGPSNFSEDCLTLNVARPVGAHNLPVAVWIYGGAFAIGSSSQPAYNLSNFVNASQAANKPLIAVSLNYRLSYFGFLAGSDLQGEGNTNLGLWDQRLALRWIKENIASFGGDPTKITVFGESAGAMSIAAHMLAFNGRNDNLFRGAIMESGAPTTGLYQSSTSSASQSAYDTVVSKAGCSSASDKLSCLRALSYSAIYNALLPSSSFTLPTFFPVIDGGFIAQSPSKQVANGQFIKIPTIQGHNDDEGALFTTSVISDNDTYTRSYITGSWPFFTSTDVDNLMTEYPNIPSLGVPYGEFGNQTFPDYGSQWRRVASITGDVLFIGPCRLFCTAQASTVYRYRANLTDPTGQFPPMLGSTHAIELEYVWNTPAVRTTSDLSRTVDFMSRAWVSFVVDQNPNHHGLSGIATWNKYNAASQGQNFVIATNSFSTELDTYRTDGINTINNAVLKL